MLGIFAHLGIIVPKDPPILLDVLREATRIVKEKTTVLDVQLAITVQAIHHIILSTHALQEATVL